MIKTKLFTAIVFLIFNIDVICNATKKDSLLALIKTDSISNNDKYLFYIYKNLAYEANGPDEIIRYSDKALEFAKELKSKRFIAAAFAAKSRSYIQRGALDEGIQYLLRSKELYQEDNCQEGVVTICLLLADSYRRNAELKKAIGYYEVAINGYIVVNDTVKLSTALLNKGELHRDIGECADAVKLFYKALILFTRVNHKIGIAYAKGNIGLVYTAQNKLDSAEIYLNKSIEILEPLGDNYAVSSYLDGLAEVYYKRKEYCIAKQTSHKSLRLAQEHGLKEQIRDASLRLSTIYDHFKDFKKAFYHHKQYVAYRDSIVNEETIRNIANLSAKYDVAQKQKAVDAEKAQKESYLMITIASAVIVLLLLVLVFIVLKVNRERRKSNNQLTKQHKALEKASTTKNKFFSILSHDLRSPLATFHGYSEVINLFVQHNDFKKLSVISKEIKSSSANLLDLLDNLLQWGVNQMDTLQSVPSKVSLQDVVIMEIKHLQHVSAKKDIAIHTLLAENITLFVDRVKLSIAIRNLLNNAIKFTPSGGSITISSYQEELNIILKITDTGVGMTPVQIKSLYDFNHIESTYGTQNEKGVGLGMQLVKEFVQQSNAQIKVESQLGEGTTFKLIFKGDNENI